MARVAAALKRATNISLNADLIEEARSLDVNISQACERGLEEQVAKMRTLRWREENRDAILSSNDYVEKHGVPLARHRMF